MIDVGVTVRAELSRWKRFRAAVRRGLAAAGAVPALDAMFVQWGGRYATFVRRRFLEQSAGGGEWPPLSLSTLLSRRKGKVGKQIFSVTGRTAALTPEFKTLQRTVFRKMKSKFKAAGMGNRTATALARAHSFNAVRRAGGKIRTSRESAALWVAGGNVAILRDTGVLYNAISIGAVGNSTARKGPTMSYGIGGPAPHPDQTGKSPRTIGQIAEYHQMGGAIPGRPPQRRILVPPTEQVVATMNEDMARAGRRILNEEVA